MPAASAAVLILLLTHPSQSLTGAVNGLRLWSKTVLPTLLPFMICSNVIVSCKGLPLLMFPLRPVLRGIWGLSDEEGYVLVSGLLCGYPMGAKTCAEFLAQGRISPQKARYLLAICNHPSPMFVLGYLASFLGPESSVRLVLACLYLPVLPLAALALLVYRPDSASNSLPSGQSGQTSEADAASFDAIMMRSIEVMVRIGGFIMLFSILAVFISRVTIFPEPLKGLLLGLTEITTGIPAIARSMDGPMRDMCLTAVTAFGGLSGIFQTNSVLHADLPVNPPVRPQYDTAPDRSRTQAAELQEAHHRRSPSAEIPAQKENAGLSIRHYILWKLLHALISCLLYILLRNLPALQP